MYSDHISNIADNEPLQIVMKVLFFSLYYKNQTIFCHKALPFGINVTILSQNFMIFDEGYFV